jgi:hypothetical protein
VAPPEPAELSTELGSYRDGSAAASFFPVRKRYITLGGYCVASDESQAERLHDILVRDAFPRNQVITLERHESVPKFVGCRRSGPIEMDWSVVRNAFRWQTTVMCEDPFKYALTEQSYSTGVSGTSLTGHSFPVTFPMSFTGTGSVASGISFYNEGTADSTNFFIQLNGPLAKGAWRLVNETTGGTLGYNVGLGAGDFMTLYFKEQTASLNDVPVIAPYTGTFWSLAPGSNAIRLYAEYDANASATIYGFSAWE